MTPAARKLLKPTSAFLFVIIGSHAVSAVANAPARLRVGHIQYIIGLPLSPASLYIIPAALFIFQNSTAGGTAISKHPFGGTYMHLGGKRRTVSEQRFSAMNNVSFLGD